MTPIEPPYVLLRVDEHEWRFDESDVMREATLRFNDALEKGAALGRTTSILRQFLNENPDHIDALHHYAMCKLDEGKPLDAFAFAHAAVAIARRTFPPEFVVGLDRLRGGWVENRPFLRAMYGLMVAHAAIFKRSDAIEIARELLKFDPEDRLGARLSLPEYLLEEGRNSEALALFDEPGLEDTFHVVEYLKALALLRLGREEAATKVLLHCLSNYPRVAQFILNPDIPCPSEGGAFGIEVGSPYEGWHYGTRYTWLWQTPKNAKGILLPLAAPIAAAGWPRTFSFQ